jgi:hypothetical protein
MSPKWSGGEFLYIFFFNVRVACITFTYYSSRRRRRFVPNPRLCCSLSFALFLRNRFPKSSEQYRIRGRLHFVGNDDSTLTTVTTTTKTTKTTTTGTTASSEISDYFRRERRQVWGNLSDAAREQFYWDDPGLPFAPSSDDAMSTTPTSPPTGGRDVDGRVLPPPDNFLLMLLYPFRVDYLRLTDNYRRVDEWCAKGGGGTGMGALRRDEDLNHSGLVCRWESMRVNP